MGVQARAKAREQRAAREAAQKKQRRRQRWIATSGGLIIVGLLIAITISLINAASGATEASPTAASTAATVAPAGAADSGAIVVGQSSAPVRVEIFLDYMCPYCGRFERANGGELARLVAAGTIRLELHPLSFLDRMSQGARYSTRSANAAAAVADGAPDKLLPFTAALYAHQPEENSHGLTDDQIADLARSAGVPAEVADRFMQRIFEPWVAATTKQAFASGITGTPTVRINGQQFTGDLYTVGPLTDAITAAKAR